MSCLTLRVGPLLGTSFAGCTLTVYRIIKPGFVRSLIFFVLDMLRFFCLSYPALAIAHRTSPLSLRPCARRRAFRYHSLAAFILVTRLFHLCGAHHAMQNLRRRAVSHRQDNSALLSLLFPPFLLSPFVVYLYITLSPGPGEGHRRTHAIEPFFSLFPSPQDSRYARYYSPRAFQAFRERGLFPSLFLPCAFAFPSGTRTRFGPDLSPNSLAAQTFHLRYTIMHGLTFNWLCNNFKPQFGRRPTPASAR